MFLLKYSLVSVLGLLLHQAVAQTIRNAWVVPDGTADDLAQTFTNGSSLAIAWTGWNASVRILLLDDTATTGNLWVTSYKFDQVHYSQLLAENVNFAGPGSYSWAINIDAKSLSSTSEYALRFSSLGTNFDSGLGGPLNIPSPGFIIQPGVTTSSSRSSTLSTSTASTQLSTTGESSTSSTSIATSTSSTTSVSAPTSTSTSAAQVTTGLKTGAIVGIAVGSAIGGIVFAGLFFLAFGHYKRSKIPPPSTVELKGYYAPQHRSRTPPLTELPTALPEFDTISNTSELPGSYGTR